MTDATNHPGYRWGAVPIPPESLSEGAHQEWINLAPIVYELQTARTADLRAFRLLCEINADISALQDTIRKDGYTVEAGSGGRKGHPALASLEKARRHAQSLLDRFGLLPGSEARRVDKYSSAKQHGYRYG